MRGPHRAGGPVLVRIPVAWRLSSVAALIAVVAAAVPAQTPPGADAEIAALRAQVEALSQRLAELEARLAGPPPADAAPPPSAPHEDPPNPAPDDAPPPQPRLSAGSDGFRIESQDRRFSLRIGGRMAFQTAWFDQDRDLRSLVGTEHDAFGFAFARIALEATLWERIAARMEFDFAGEDGGDSPRFRDVYMEYRDIPYGGGRGFDFRVGHFYEPFNLEEITSVSHLMFNSRSVANVFAPGRNAGFLASDRWLGDPDRERLSLAVGVFRETDDWPSAGDSVGARGYQVTGRLTGLPWYADEGRRLIHLGAAYSSRRPRDLRMNLGVDPESNLANYQYLDPDALPIGFRLRDGRVRAVDLAGAEAAWIHHRLTVQGEYVHARVDTTLGGALNLHSHYIQGGVFLTPDHRRYRHSDGTLGGVVPARPVRLRLAAEGEEQGRGWGAWEILARWAAVDLDDRWLRGGAQQSATLGLNWFLNRNARVNLNYTRTWVDRGRIDGHLDILQSHFQVDF